eukprot:737689-Alexandrium_andersonii.AAC.1
MYAPKAVEGRTLAKRGRASGAPVGLSDAAGAPAGSTGPTAASSSASSGPSSEAGSAPPTVGRGAAFRA